MIKFWKRSLSIAKIACEPFRLPKTLEDRRKIIEFGESNNLYSSCIDVDFCSPRRINAQSKGFFALGGRVQKIRKSGRKLMFIDLQQEEKKVQITLNAAECKDFDEIVSCLQRGDIIGVKGHFHENNIRAESIKIYTPVLKHLPDIHAPSLNIENRSRNRHLDLIVNHPKSINNFRQRSNVIRKIHDFLQDRQFMQVETPILSGHSTGATATPFVTQESKQANNPLSLRIAPELWLKKLVVGGFDAVYEIGKVFRNEGVDSTHNPEFTMLEMYKAFSDVNYMLRICEEMVRMTVALCSENLQIIYKANLLDFSSPFAKIDVSSELEKHLSFPVANFWEDPIQARESSLKHLKELGVRVEKESLAHLLDRIIEYHLEAKCIQPTFLTNHPSILCPLAKGIDGKPWLSERFELFIGGMEIANGYSELADPHEQRKRFGSDYNEAEAEFVDVLECGMPPTSGCGIGIDRLVMLLLNKEHIRDVLLFPIMKSQSKNQN